MILMISIIAINTFPSLSVILSSLLTNCAIILWSSRTPGGLLVGATTIDAFTKPPATSAFLSDYHLVWFDDFDGEELDRRKWYPLIDCSGRGNNELQCYTSQQKNVRVRNGHLELTAVAEDYAGRNFTSGRVHASGRGWTYGWFEARARLAKGMHLWPAIWLVPTDGAYGSWPRSGEIDMMESRGQDVHKLESTIHFGSSRSDRGKIGSSMIHFPFDFSQDFHIFGFQWTNQSMKWFLDGMQYFETSTDRFFTDKKGERIYQSKGAPFDRNFKWVLNLAVGGFFFPPDVYGRLKRSDALEWSKPVMEVDWVRVFQKKADMKKNQTPIADVAGTRATASTAPVPTSTPIPASTSLFASKATTAVATKRETEVTTIATTFDPSTTSREATPATVITSSEAALTSQVPAEVEDKKNKDLAAQGDADKKATTNSDVLNEKKMNEVVSDPDTSDEDYDNISAMDQRGNPLNNDYYDYY